MSNISNVGAARANSDLFVTRGHFFSLSTRPQSGVPPEGIGVNWCSQRNALGVDLPLRRLEQALRPWISRTTFTRRTAQTKRAFLNSASIPGVRGPRLRRDMLISRLVHRSRCCDDVQSSPALHRPATTMKTNLMRTSQSPIRKTASSTTARQEDVSI